jgi:hypothetical protein
MREPPGTEPSTAAAIPEWPRESMQIGAAPDRSAFCGQAPSDYPDFAQFMVKHGIDSISPNPDTLLKTTVAILEKERGLKR